MDTIEAERFSALGDEPLRLIDLAARDAHPVARETMRATQAIAVGLDRRGQLPLVDEAVFDALLTTAPDAPAPWVSVPDRQWSERIVGITAHVAHAPVAATLAMRVLRMGQGLPFDHALALESLAYSTLLGGEEFRRWRTANPAHPAPPAPAGFVAMDRIDDCLTIRLTDPANRNAMSAGMRDALFNALAAAIDDPTAPSVQLEAEGRCFSTGGDLTEFGTAQDLATAHVVRTLRNSAALLHQLGDRATVILHGACVGSGLEIPAAAHRRIARPGAFFHLPELAMGLMPGGGGTVTLPRAIGRHRAATMMLSARRIDVATAYDWGLIHAIEAAP